MSESPPRNNSVTIPAFLILSDTSDDEGESLADEDKSLLKTPQRPTKAVPSNTPSTKTENSIKATFPEQSAEIRQQRLAIEMKNRCIGPMPIDKLLEISFPRCEAGKQEPDEADVTGSCRSNLYFRSVPTGKLRSETELYKPLVCYFAVV